jgi:hypothetical protein
LGEQAFILNRTAAALLLADGDKNAFESLRSTLPACLCLQNIAGFERLPQERLAYHLQDISSIAHKYDLSLEEQAGDISAIELFMRATQPCGEMDWRDKLRGSSLSIFFLSTLDRTPAFRMIFFDIAQGFGIPEAVIGIYIQPVVQNHSCHIEFILPFDPNSQEEIERMRQFERQVVIRLMEAGAFFSRPYGSAGELVWAQNTANYQLLKTVKGIFDPRRVLQRNKWDL